MELFFCTEKHCFLPVSSPAYLEVSTSHLCLLHSSPFPCIKSPILHLLILSLSLFSSVNAKLLLSMVTTERNPVYATPVLPTNNIYKAPRAHTHTQTCVYIYGHMDTVSMVLVWAVGSSARRQRSWRCCKDYYQQCEPDICRAAEREQGDDRHWEKTETGGRQGKVSEGERERARLREWGNEGGKQCAQKRERDRERGGCRSIQMRVGVLDKEKSTTRAALSLFLSLKHTHTHICVHTHTQAPGSSQASATAEKKLLLCCARQTHSRFCLRIYTSSLIHHPFLAGFNLHDRSFFLDTTSALSPFPSFLQLDSEKETSGRLNLHFYLLAPLHADPLHTHHAPCLASFSSPLSPLYLPSLHLCCLAALPKDSSKAWRAPSTATLPATTWCGSASCLSQTAAATAWMATPYWNVCPSTPL